MLDALRLPGAGAAPLPASAGGGGGININVTDVAWSLPQSYIVDNGMGSFDSNGNLRQEGGDGYASSASGHRGSDNLGDSYEELLASDEPDQHALHDHHYPPFIKRKFVDGRELNQSFSSMPAFGHTSVVAAAGSNGVVVAWNAQALVGDLTTSSSNNSGGGPGGLFHDRKRNVGASQVSPSASIGQPEAAFLAHSRAVNRLAWHPTGHRPYLLLTASQDGTVKLWDRRATSSSTITGGDGNIGSSSVQSSFNLSAKSWFGFGGSSSVPVQLSSSNAMSQTAMWHCVSTFQPKCEAVRDIKWNPFIDYGKFTCTISISAQAFD